MKKIVNVKAIMPVTGVKQIVRGSLTKVEMTTEDIYKCLCCRAKVDEVIGDNLIALNFDNYNKVNAPEQKVAVIPTAPVVTAPKAPEKVEAPAPVVTETITVEDTVAVEDTAVVEEVPAVEEQVSDGTGEEMVGTEVAVGEEATLTAESDEEKVEDTATTNGGSRRNRRNK